jgi:hypothetical protein
MRTRKGIEITPVSGGIMITPLNTNGFQATATGVVDLELPFLVACDNGTNYVVLTGPTTLPLSFCSAPVQSLAILPRLAAASIPAIQHEFTSFQACSQTRPMLLILHHEARSYFVPSRTCDGLCSSGLAVHGPNCTKRCIDYSWFQPSALSLMPIALVAGDHSVQCNLLLSLSRDQHDDPAHQCHYADDRRERNRVMLPLR